MPFIIIVVFAPVVWMYAAMFGVLAVFACYATLLGVAYVYATLVGTTATPTPDQSMTYADYQAAAEAEMLGRVLGVGVIGVGVFTFVSVCAWAGAPLPGQL